MTGFAAVASDAAAQTGDVPSASTLPNVDVVAPRMRQVRPQTSRPAPATSGTAANTDADQAPVTSASEKNFSGDEVNARPFSRPAEALEVVPGLIVTQHSGDGKANQYFLRGFNLDPRD